MEIEVGEYVRTRDGFIRKIDKIEKCPICKEKEYINKEIINGLHFENIYHKKDIVKHSKNIIHLIEVGDILETEKGKYEVIYDESIDKLGILIPDRKQLAIRHSAIEFVFKEYKNVSIVTKEAFKNIEYRLE